MNQVTDVRQTAPTGPAKSARRRFASLRTIMALVLREMATTYGRSPGGYIWAVLEPVAGIALLTAIFSIGFRAPPIGSNFPIFYATGLVPFLMYTDVSQKTAMSVVFSRPLLAYPSVTFLDALLGRFIVNMITQTMVAYLVLGGIYLFMETRTVLNFPFILQSLALIAILSFGIGSLNCYLFTRFPITQRIWTIVNRPLLLLSCIFYLFDGVPQPYRDWLWYNPLVHIVGLMRRGFYPTYDAPYVSVAYVAGIGLVTGAMGLLLLHRHHRTLLQL